MLTEKIRSFGTVRFFAAAVTVLYALLFIMNIFGYGFDYIVEDVDKIVIIQWSLPLIYGLILFIFPITKDLMPALGGYFVITSIPGIIYNMQQLQAFGYADILMLISVFAYIIQLAGGIGMLYKNNNLGIIMLASVLIELLIAFWNPIYIFRRDYVEFSELLIFYSTEIPRYVCMLMVAYILITPKFLQSKDTAVINDRIYDLSGYTALPPNSYLVRGDLIRLIECIEGKGKWDLENIDDIVVAESAFRVFIPAHKMKILLLQKRSNGNLYISLINEKDSSYVTGVSFPLESYVPEGDVETCRLVSLYGNSGKFIRIRVFDIPETLTLEEKLSIRLKIPPTVDDFENLLYRKQKL